MTVELPLRAARQPGANISDDNAIPRGRCAPMVSILRVARSPRILSRPFPSRFSFSHAEKGANVDRFVSSRWNFRNSRSPVRDIIARPARRARKRGERGYERLCDLVDNRRLYPNGRAAGLSSLYIDERDPYLGLYDPFRTRLCVHSRNLFAALPPWPPARSKEGRLMESLSEGNLPSTRETFYDPERPDKIVAERRIYRRIDEERAGRGGSEAARRFMYVGGGRGSRRFKSGAERRVASRRRRMSMASYRDRESFRRD